ncbi:hypothetical protein [Flavobacterium soyangense]|uniref:Uncharacterized protein n=1 Tax=Flavobacterium soyangense TaxID=2023265 RepID=A0A930XX07_9FLAO|nr:hypothetical protein [Flavobacterium soyangense]MBF2709742.1 hypothetical protein [Flavobacterium soyangense]
MKVKSFFSLNQIQGLNNENLFHRKKGEYSTKSGVYFWGFKFNENSNLPVKIDDFVIYYIGKSNGNISERIMQEVTQLVFGGFGTILDQKYLEINYNQAKIKNEQDNPSSKNVIYRSDGLHVLENFFADPKIVQTVNWMRKNLIFTWIECDKIEVAALENEMHHIVRTNILGVGNMKNLTPKKDIFNPKHNTDFFKKVDWDANTILRDWLIEVNKNIS